jgi:hypothetical protein
MSTEDLAGYAPLAGQSFSASDGAIAILLEMVTPAGRDALVSVPILTFRVNDGLPQTERLMTNILICSRPDELDPCPSIDPPR